VRAITCAPILASLALAAGCGHGSSATAPPADSGGEDAGDGGIPEVPRAPSALALADIVGLSTHIQLGSDAASLAERAFEWSKLAELGVHRMRADFTWSAIEPSRGSFDFSRYDTLVSEAQQHGVSLLPILDYGVPWATSVPGADDHYPPDHPSDFASYAVAVANRYAGKVTEYEVWNEPNVGVQNWKPNLKGDPAAYGALLLATNQALLAAQPQLRVAYAGTEYHYLLSGPDFVAQSFADTTGLASSLGTFAMHAYEKYPPSYGPESTYAGEVPLLDKVATMSGALAAAGAKAMPIWITEIGWPVTMTDSLAQQARYTVRGVVLGALAGADRVYLYTLLDGPPQMGSILSENVFGLCTYSDFSADSGTPSEKPAFIGVKALLGAVGAYHVVKRLPASPSDVYLVQLAGPGGNAWVAWRATDGAALTPVAVPATGNVAVTSIDGSVKNDAAGASGYTLQLGPDPIVVAPR
jgi:hypothetical protein